MVSADKSVAVEFSLAEQRALVWAAASKGAPPAAGSRQDNVHPVRGQRERSCALELAEIGDTKERFGLHGQTLTGRGLDRAINIWPRAGRIPKWAAFYIISARSNNSARGAHDPPQIARPPYQPLALSPSSVVHTGSLWVAA
jgi:hypothetical protein